MLQSLEHMRTTEHPISERVLRGIPVQNLPTQRDNLYHRNRKQKLLLVAGGLLDVASLVLLLEQRKRCCPNPRFGSAF